MCTPPPPPSRQDELGFAAHPFVCIAIIDQCEKELEELEHLESAFLFLAVCVRESARAGGGGGGGGG